VENEEEHDSLFGVAEHYSRFHDAAGRVINHDPEVLIRTQDLPPLCEENSCVYVFTKESFAKHGRRIGETPLMFATPAVQSIDIDDEFQFRLAELLALYTGWPERPRRNGGTIAHPHCHQSVRRNQPAVGPGTPVGPGTTL